MGDESAAGAENWVRMAFKNQKVWVAADENGKPKVENGRVRLRYKKEDAQREYQAAARNVAALLPDGSCPAQALPTAKTGPPGRTGSPAKPGTPQKAGRKGPGPQAMNGHEEADEDRAVIIYTDGACTGNPGPAGIGVVMRHKGKEKLVSEYLGNATNNIAELTAILRALELLKKKDMPVRLYTDSQYCQGLFVSGWKAKANTELVEAVRKRLRTFSDLKIIYVPGHAGVPENERADQLAREAILKRSET
ncbi:MAG: ribonuclease H [Thermodesulfobacteriota bacterium]